MIMLILKKESSIHISNYWKSVLKARDIQKRYDNNGSCNPAFDTYFNGQVSEQDFQKFTGILPGKFHLQAFKSKYI